MFCGKCGSKIKEGDNFCVNCGAKVENEMSKEDVNKSNNKITIQPFKVKFLNDRNINESEIGENDKGLYDQFRKLVSLENYEKLISESLSVADNHSKLENLYSIFDCLDKDENFNEKLFHLKFGLWGEDDLYGEVLYPIENRLYDEIHKVLDNEYNKDKKNCDDIIANIKFEIEKYNRHNDDWEYENIVGYEKKEFDCKKCALSLIETKKYTILQLLTSFYKMGHDISEKKTYNDLKNKR